MGKLFRSCAVVILAAGFVACDDTGKQSTMSAPAENASAGNVDWRYHGNDRSEQRFSELEQINRQTIDELGLAWFLDLPEPRGQEATPIVVDGIMYTTAAWNHVYAIDAASGEVLWHHDPEVPKTRGVHACCDSVNRGVAVEDGKVFTGTLDGRLLALDSATGDVIWSVVTVDQSKAYTITGAPRVANGRVFIGNGGAEYGVRGYLSAYDAGSGEMVWRFYTVPGAPGDPTGTEPLELQAPTWNGEYWRFGGGGTVWDSMAYDESTDTLFFGVGNGSPWNPNTRTDARGDNLFLSSIVAVDASTGQYKWHYQTTPMEGWDFTATQHIVLADMEWQGERRRVLMQAPKNGFFYVLDRETGELLGAEPFAPVNWASHVDLDSGRPVINPEAKYWETGKAALVTPSWMGAHNWHPMSFDPERQVMYLPTQETAFPYLGEDDQTPAKLAVNLGVDTKAAALPDDSAVIKQVKDSTKGHLLAWDVQAQAPVWKVEYPGAWNGGVLATAGDLVFQGSAAGFLHAYSAIDGADLWEYPVQTGVVAPPVTYAVDGEQYLTVSAGWGGIFPLMTGVLVEDTTGPNPRNKSRLLTFKLGGNASLPPVKVRNRELAGVEPAMIDPELSAEGFAVYDRYCVNCHGAAVVSGGVLPDLRYSSLVLSDDDWQRVVHDGILKERGMMGYSSELSRSEVTAIRHYVMSRALRESRAEK